MISLLLRCKHVIRCPSWLLPFRSLRAFAITKTHHETLGADLRRFRSSPNHSPPLHEATFFKLQFSPATPPFPLVSTKDALAPPPQQSSHFGHSGCRFHALVGLALGAEGLDPPAVSPGVGGVASCCCSCRFRDSSPDEPSEDAAAPWCCCCACRGRRSLGGALLLLLIVSCCRTAGVSAASATGGTVGGVVAAAAAEATSSCLLTGAAVDITRAITTAVDTSRDQQQPFGCLPPWLDRDKANSGNSRGRNLLPSTPRYHRRWLSTAAKPQQCRPATEAASRAEQCTRRDRRYLPKNPFWAPPRDYFSQKILCGGRG